MSGDPVIAPSAGGATPPTDGAPAGGPPVAPAPPLDWRVRVGVALGVPLLRLLAATWRVRTLDLDVWDTRKARGEGTLVSLWHGQMLPILMQHAGYDVGVLISEHRDGEIIARIAKALGNTAVRGSTTRGGGRALLALVARLRGGDDVAVTPDGPRGPYRSVAPGATVAAYRAEVPLVAIATHCDRSWRLRSWDRFEIPKPFARVTIAYSPPWLVQAANAREAAAQGDALAALMDATERRAIAEGARRAGRGAAPA